MPRTTKPSQYQFHLLEDEGDMLPFYCEPTLNFMRQLRAAAYKYAKTYGFKVSVTLMNPKSEMFWGRTGAVVQRVASDYKAERVDIRGILKGRLESCGDRARATGDLWRQIGDAFDATGDETNGCIEKLLQADPQLVKHRSRLFSMANGLGALYPYDKQLVQRRVGASQRIEEAQLA